MKRNRNRTQRYCGLQLWSCFSNEFPEVMSSSSLVSIDSVTYLSTPFTILTHEAALSSNRDGTRTAKYCIDHHDCKLLCSRLGRISYSCESVLFIQVALSFRGMVYSRHKCCISCPFSVTRAQKYCPFSTSSNPHQSIIWIISGIRTLVRIFARILAPGFPVAAHCIEFLQ